MIIIEIIKKYSCEQQISGFNQIKDFKHMGKKILCFIKQTCSHLNHRWK